ncbi:EFR1 family ferrodoxin [Clostridium sp. CF012]|uniref:EFR1 family ferrodoxin n=1 Tax=Clostridium sp. CF012 TaxID=2843319 RepID=UPI001C0C16B8|nr:EFR1 family ferrodoxin [Clostridium sp. CF012]MBU3144017.1 EFR1 family ferrodoxin [Clostridium sp. CF012]
METSIYYFSGTGNSLYISKRIAEKMGNVKLHSITKIERKHVINSEVIGLIFPVHALDIPVMVKEFITNTDMKKVKYIFCVATCGEKAGNAIFYLDKILKTKKKELDYGIVMELADNSIYYTTYNAPQYKCPGIKVEELILCTN